MPSSLIRSRYLITHAVSPTEANVIDDGAVLQRDGKIVEIGTFEDLQARHDVDEVLGGPDCVITPGFVNAHHHLGLTPVQHGCQDLPLELWFASMIQQRDVDPYLDTLYSAFELIASGVTTVQHLSGWSAASAEQIVADSERMIDAYRDIGMRVSFSHGIWDQNHLVYGDNRAFAESLPGDLGSRTAAHLQAMDLPLDEQLGVFDHLFERHQDSERTRIQLAPNNFHWCSDDALDALRDHAARYGVPMHMHLLETPYQKEYALRRTGGSAVEYLERRGLLGPDMTFGHGVWMTEADIEILAATGTHICHNPSSNMRLRSGTLPLDAFERKGIRVAIGIDEAGINDDRDMLQEMRLVKNVHRAPGMDDRVPGSGQILRMATEDGAHTTPFSHEIGVLAPGKAADLVIMDWNAIAQPFQRLDRDISVLDAVIHRAKASGVKTVLVAGETVYRDGKFTRVDRDAILLALAERMARPLTSAEEDRLKLGRELMGPVKDFYDGWLDHEVREPFDQRNTRR
jgi:5-methylthioadenosine/S-adenosylhomocysteine deaminase